MLKSHLKVFFLFLFSLTVSFSQQKVIFVTYGPESPPSSGDFYYMQFIHFKVPASVEMPAYIRFYDIGCGGEYDSKYGEECTRFQVTLFNDFVNENSFSSGPKSFEENNYTISLFKVIADEEEYINKWITFAQLDKNKGTLIDGFRYYSLLIKALNGNDANGFDVFLSSSAESNVEIPGAKIVCYEPTLRIQTGAGRYTFRLERDEFESVYTVRNFDFDNAALAYSSFLKPYTLLYSSGDGIWGTSKFTLNKHEIGNDLGITVGPNYSTKIENDLVFAIYDTQNRKVPLIYPPAVFTPEQIPILRTETKYLDDCKSVELIANSSTDPENRELNAKWFFEDGTEETGLIVQKSFSSAGKYSPEVLLFNNSNDITRAVLAKVPITINILPISVAGVNKIAATNEILSFDGSTSTDADGRIVSYGWDFGDGNKGSGIRVRHSYSAPGEYTVSLRVEDNFSSSPCRFSESSLKVFVNAKPLAVTKTELIGSENETITFTAEQSSDSDGEIIQYLWNFGAFGTKEGAVVAHSFPYPGVFKVKLTVRDNSNAKNNTDTKEVIVRINHPPLSNPGSNLLAAINETITFDGTRSNDKDGDIIRYDWDFGDGNKANGAIVNHSYDKSGTYKVVLTVTDNSNTTSASSSAELLVFVNEPPVASAGENQFLNTALAQFDGSSSYDNDGSISHYLWSFGDGKKGNGVKVTHLYKKPGVYNVELTVIDNTKAKNNFSTSNMIVTVNAKPVANAGKNLVVAPGEKINLSASESYDPDGKITEYIWSLGGEIVSNVVAFEYQINEAGYYQINLSVKDDFKFPSFDYSAIDVLVNKAPAAIINAPLLSPVNSSVTFDAGLSKDFEGGIKEYMWEFGDGTNAVGKIVNKTFSKAGRYKVKLFVTDEQSVSNSVSAAEASIFINSSPFAKSEKEIKTCNTFITLDASGSVDPDGDPITCYWNFYDGSPLKTGFKIQHDFQKPGIYPVQLIVDDNNGLSNSRDSLFISVAINYPPVSIIGNDTIICSGDILILNALSSYDPEGGVLKYEWFFDDGTSLEGESVTKTWRKSGTYQVTLKVIDNSGLPCNSTFDTKLVTVLESPVANAGDDITTCINTPVYFDGSKSTDIDGVVNAFEWDFGDGEFGNGERPVHVYKNPGTYKVNLIITGDYNGNCDNKSIDNLTVIVNQGPTAYFESKDSIAVGEMIYFDASSSSAYEGTITSYEWDFGDGEFGSGSKVNHLYKSYGNYQVKLSIKTDANNECNQTSFSKNIFVNEPPIAKAGENISIAANESFFLDASKSYDKDGNISKYLWQFSNGYIKEGKIIEHSLDKSGTYPIILTVEDNTNMSNNRSKDTLFVSVNEPPAALIKSEEDIYGGSILTIDGSSSIDKEKDSIYYFWYINNKPLNENGDVVKHKFHFPGIYSIKLKVKDNSGFENNYSIANKTVKVHPIPTMSLGEDINVCSGTKLEIKPKLSHPTISDTKIEWLINNSVIAINPVLNHYFTGKGKQIIIAKLIDEIHNDKILASDTLVVDIISLPEITKFSDRTVYTGAANDYIVFDAEEVINKLYDNLNFYWDFGDRKKAVGKKVIHRYERPGIYIVTLNIDDGKKTECSKVTRSFTVFVKKY